MQREKWIDVCKGYAIILVVLGHLLQGLFKANIFTNKALFDYIDFTIYSFHMPLFFMLSGYLYSKVDEVNNFCDYKIFLNKKFINLSVPYFAFSVLQLSMNMFLSSYVNSPFDPNRVFFALFLKPISPFWFLYTLFFMFLIIPIIELVIKNKVVILWLLSVLKILGFMLKSKIFLVSSLSNFLIYFYVGCFLYDNKKYLEKFSFKISLSSFMLCYTFLNIIYYFLLIKYSSVIINVICSVLLAISGSLASIVLFYTFSNRKNIFMYILNEVGMFSLHIFLLHTIFSAGIRIILLKILDIDSFIIHVILGLSIGVIGPICVGYLARPCTWLNFFFYPKSIINRKEAVKI